MSDPKMLTFTARLGLPDGLEMAIAYEVSQKELTDSPESTMQRVVDRSYQSFIEGFRHERLFGLRPQTFVDLVRSKWGDEIAAETARALEGTES